ncbi:MAG: fluoride efflux transporter CrcB [Candidatus Sericytochromatia bacterium]
MNKLLLVGLGGFLGSSLRYLISLPLAKYNNFAYATLIANFLGCFIIGILMNLFTSKINNIELRLFLVTGIMGGLTTFSTFSYETFYFIRNTEYLKAIANIFISLFGCLFLTSLGYILSEKIFK